MKPTVLLDVDGVLLDWFSRFPYFLKEKGLDTEHAIRMFANNQFSSLEELTGLSTEHATELSIEYQQSKYMKYLSPYKDALQAVNLLKHKYNFVAVTAVLDDPLTHQYRTENLDFWYPGAFSKVHCVGINQSKFEILSKYDRTVFVDDSPGHIIEAKNAGHIAIRLKVDARPDVTQSLIANNWQELSNMIQMMVPA